MWRAPLQKRSKQKPMQRLNPAEGEPARDCALAAAGRQARRHEAAAVVATSCPSQRSWTSVGGDSRIATRRATKAGGTEQSAPATRTSASRADPRLEVQISVGQRITQRVQEPRSTAQALATWRSAGAGGEARRPTPPTRRLGPAGRPGREGPERQEARLAVSERPLDPVACVRRGRQSTPVPRGSYLNPNRSCLMRLLVVLGERD